jgi:hypothetical protein
MLKGEAKTAYMREYMRRRRAGLATAKPRKPKPPWQPPPCRRYKSHRDAQHEAPKSAAVQREAAKKACWFCGEPASGDRIVIAAPAGCPLICEMCVAEAARIIADKRK